VTVLTVFAPEEPHSTQKKWSQRSPLGFLDVISNQKLTWKKERGKKLNKKRWVIARKMEIGKFTENSLGKFTVILP